MRSRLPLVVRRRARVTRLWSAAPHPRPSTLDLRRIPSSRLRKAAAIVSPSVVPPAEGSCDTPCVGSTATPSIHARFAPLAFVTPTQGRRDRLPLRSPAGRGPVCHASGRQRITPAHPRTDNTALGSSPHPLGPRQRKPDSRRPPNRRTVPRVHAPDAPTPSIPARVTSRKAFVAPQPGFRPTPPLPPARLR
jgi:hypothetical protein